MCRNSYFRFTKKLFLDRLWLGIGHRSRNYASLYISGYRITVLLPLSSKQVISVQFRVPALKEDIDGMD
jgi:hypothetical protein